MNKEYTAADGVDHIQRYKQDTMPKQTNLFLHRLQTSNNAYNTCYTNKPCSLRQKYPYPHPAVSPKLG